MNISSLTTWVDDLLKRRLHEAIGDLGPYEIEVIEDAKLKQDRHRPEGITQEDYNWAQNCYFDRLLRGCLFRNLITEIDGSPTEYSELIADIVRFRVVEGSPELSPSKRTLLRDKMMDRARDRYREVKTAWTSVEFAGCLSYKWWDSLDPKHENLTCRDVAQDADTYLDLVVRWPIFVRAMQRLAVFGNHWLYHSVN